jgi:hypothetical protein
MTNQEWRDEIGIKLGMTKQQALEKFAAWRANKKTCFRCEGEKYIDYCPIHLICKEADNVTGDDNRGGTLQTDESKALRTEIFEARKRASIR